MLAVMQQRALDDRKKGFIILKRKRTSGRAKYLISTFSSRLHDVLRLDYLLSSSDQRFPDLCSDSLPILRAHLREEWPGALETKQYCHVVRPFGSFIHSDHLLVRSLSEHSEHSSIPCLVSWRIPRCVPRISSPRSRRMPMPSSRLK